MTNKPSPAKPRALIVLAPPCAGASAVAGALGLAGATWPAHLTEPTVAHPRGSWRSEPISALAAETLAAAGLDADTPGVTGPEFAGSAQAEELSARLAATLRSEFGDADLAPINDPRFCRLVPLLEDALARAGMVPRYVLVYRHPLDTAASLHRHAGIDHARGLGLWLEHIVAWSCPASVDSFRLE